MTIKNLKINKKILSLGALGLLTLSLTKVGCGKIVSQNNSYNVVIEQNNDNLSVVGIKNYKDYLGTQSQFITEDNMVILSSTSQTQVVNIESNNKLNNYAESLILDKNNIIYYDELAGTKINYSKENSTKIKSKYDFNKAIILSDDIATIVELSSWSNYGDDRIQMILTDGTSIITSSDNVKIICDLEAADDSLKNYALSLVGEESKIIFHGIKINTK